jgi:hypothetical protein
MKALSTLAMFLGHLGMATANDSGQNYQDDRRATGPDLYMMVPSKLRTMWRADDAFAMYSVQHHLVKPHVKK